MALGQALLDIMEDLNGELQLQSGEVDVAKGLRALNAAQDLVEAVMASHPKVLGSGVDTVATVASQEYTTYPTGLLRLDSLWYIDATTARPAWRVKPIKESGQHAVGTGWVANLAYTASKGKPRAYWTNGTRIYWDPLPDAIYTVRWYGFQSAASITAAGTYAYLDLYMYPVALLASRILKTALDDPPEQFISLARDMINPLIESLSQFDRDGAVGMIYESRHDT